MKLTFHLVPHTHWDREWYLTRTGFQSRLVPVVDALLDQLERDREARFVLDGQTVLLEDYLRVRPEQASRVAAQVRKGSLEVGPWYVLADLLIPSGESLLRNLGEGARDAARLGRRMNVLYSPDAFGHPAALPAIALEFGLSRAVIRRGLGRPHGEDRDFYRWSARDGRAILVYHLPRAGYEVAIDLTRANADFDLAWAPVRGELVARASAGRVVVFLGADHHPMVRDLRGFRDRLRGREPDHEVRVTALTELFDAVESSLDGVPGISGELRRIDGHTWVLQDVHSTRPRLKRRHGLAELGLGRITEPVAALAAFEGGRDQRPLLRLAWRSLLQAQFHDTLSGSCADGVAREQNVRLEAVETLNREVGIRALHDLAGHDPDLAREIPDGTAPRLILWNPAARPRSGIVTADLTFFRGDLLIGPPGSGRARKGRGYQPFELRTAAEDAIPVQVLGVKPGYERIDAVHHHPDQDEVDRVSVAFRAPSVHGLGVAALTVAPGGGTGAPRDELLIADKSSLANRFVAVELSEAGGFTLEDLRTGERYENLCVLEDEADRGDTYTFSRGPGEPARRLRLKSKRVVASGPLVGAVERTWSMASAGSGEIEVRLLAALDADSPFVRLRLDLENRAGDHRLRAVFPVGAGRTVVAGAAFGVERRPPVEPDRRPGQIEYPGATAPAHRYVAAADGRRGLAILSPVFFEHEWNASRDLIVTLLRAVGELSRGDLPERPGHAGWPEATPLAQEYGRHTVELAVAPITALEVAEPVRLEELWEDVFLGLKPAFVRNFTGPDHDLDRIGVTLEGRGLVFSAAKPAESESGLVLRCYNASDSDTEGSWTFRRPVGRAVQIRADETGIRHLDLLGDRSSIRFTAGRGRIVTVGVFPEA